MSKGEAQGSGDRRGVGSGGGVGGRGRGPSLPCWDPQWCRVGWKAASPAPQGGVGPGRSPDHCGPGRWARPSGSAVVPRRVSGWCGLWAKFPWPPRTLFVSVFLMCVLSPLGGRPRPLPTPVRPLSGVCLQEAGDEGPAVAVGHGPPGEHAHRVPVPAHHPQHEGAPSVGVGAGPSAWAPPWLLVTRGGSGAELSGHSGPPEQEGVAGACLRASVSLHLPVVSDITLDVTEAEVPAPSVSLGTLGGKTSRTSGAFLSVQVPPPCARVLPAVPSGSLGPRSINHLRTAQGPGCLWRAAAARKPLRTPHTRTHVIVHVHTNTQAHRSHITTLTTAHM